MIQSIPNFRDAGGLPSRFGGKVATGRLFRSGLPSSASAADVGILRELDLGLIADLRYSSEREADPSPWPDEWHDRIVAYTGNSDQTAPHNQLLRAGTMSVEGSRRCYDQIFRSLPFDPSYKDMIGRLLRRFATVRAPMLVHCSAGKDRTGMVVALMHHILGVPREQIYENFLLSNQSKGLHAMAEQVRARVKEHHGHDYSPELMRHLIGVEEAYLDAFFGEIEQRAGSVDAYLASLDFDQRKRDAALANWLES